MGNTNSTEQASKQESPNQGQTLTQDGTSDCPVAVKNRRPIYNVYNQRIDTGAFTIPMAISQVINTDCMPDVNLLKD